MRKSSLACPMLAKLFLLAAVIFAANGCSRTKYRLQADRDAYDVIAERNCDPRWTAEGYSIETDPRSRYFDAYDPDRSPMPLDDPASHSYMRLVDGKKGWKHWNDNGQRVELENSEWSNALAEYVEFGVDGAVKLDVDSALRLAYVHSPAHQRQLETLYLSALDVTAERFRLDTQFFGGYDTRYVHNGSLIPAGLGFSPLLRRFVLTPKINAPGAENNRLTLGRPTRANPALQARRRFSTAGELLVGFANSFVFEFTGGDVNLAASLANFSLVQPLLRGAGKDIALEQLTQAERTLLANLRAYVQFRQGFYTQIAIGELGVTGPQRRSSSTSLQSFSGVGGVNGYIGLLQRRQQIRNAEDNLSLQLRTRDRLEALYDNELIGLVQVDQFRQGVETQRSQLLGSKNSLELAIENYKTGTLGLPPDLPVELDRSMISQFQLLPPEANEILEPLFELQARVGDLAELADLIGDAAELQDQVGVFPDINDVESIDQMLGDFLNLIETVESRLDTLRNDLIQLESGRESSPVQLTDAEEELVRLVGDRLREGPDSLKHEFEDGIAKLEELFEGLSAETIDDVANENVVMLMFNLHRLSQGCILIQANARRLDAEPQKILADAFEFIEPVRQLFATARDDLTRMEAAVPIREQTMIEKEKEDFRDDREQLHKKLTELKRGDLGFDRAEDTLNSLRDGLTEDTRGQTLKGLTAWVQAFLQVVERLSLVPARARLEIITVDSVDLDADEAFQIALANRLDFMNGRAALVDRWRLLEVNADALQSIVNVTASGDIRTARNNVVSFRAPTSTVRLGLEFDAPFTRLLERNTYRESLIEYQRSRRALIQSRDSLQLGLRAILRNLELRRQQLKIQRRAVTIALRRVDQTQLELTAPRAIGQRIDSTTATNLLSAQGSLQSSQNAFLAAWLSYYASRLRLYRELGIMVLDSEGRWLEFPIEGSSQRIEGSGEGDGLGGENLSLPPLPAVIPADRAGRANVLQTSGPARSRAGHSTAYQPPSPRQISPTATALVKEEFKMPETRD